MKISTLIEIFYICWQEDGSGLFLNWYRTTKLPTAESQNDALAVGKEGGNFNKIEAKQIWFRTKKEEMDIKNK